MQTTDETATSSNTSLTDAGVVNDGFYISGQSLMDPCGNPVVLRGVNEMPTFMYQSKDGSSYFGEITQTHSNAIRLYWQTSDSKDDLDRLLVDAEAKRMLPVVYALNNAATNSSTSFENAASYWTGPDILPVVMKHRQWLIIALRERSTAGSTVAQANWAENVDAAVRTIRQAGINVPLAVDAPQYGFDVTTLAQTGATRILTDPRQNIVFSINAWWPNASSDVIRTNITTVTNAGLPVIIGEFSGYAQNAPDCQNITYDWATIIQVAQDTHVGWFAWSWGAAANTPPCLNLNMTQGGTYATLYNWGYQVAAVAANNPYGIPSTSIPSSFVPGAGCPR